MTRVASLAILLTMIGASAQTARETHTLEFGVEQRVRSENWNNIFDWSNSTDDQRNQIRYRTRFWAKIPLGTNFELVTGLNQETNQIIGRDNHFDEVIFETAYLDVHHLFSNKLSMRVGRQNLMKGEGFLLLEGNTMDGSRSIYHNAAVISYNSGKSTLDFIGILDPAYDQYLPRIHNQHRLLQEWDESALGAYYTNKKSKQTSFESYYFYKTEVRDTRSAAHPQFQPDRHVHTAGGRVVRQLPRGWSATGEFALQRGKQYPGTPISAWGGYSYLKRTFAARSKPYILGGYWAMSGDDPRTAGRIEGWDPLFSRWPKWSEMYIYSQFPEKSPAYWTNAAMWQAEFGITPIKPLDLRVTWYRMGAFQPFPGSPRTYGAGTLRGNQLQARLGININREWSGHVLYESHHPGSFYQGHDGGYFLRFEAIFNHRWQVPLQSTALR